MPVQSQHVDALRVIAPYLARDSERQHDGHHHETGGDVSRVQTDERVVRRAKEIRRDRQTVLVDEPMPFPTGAIEKCRAQQERERPPRDECRTPPGAKKIGGNVNGEAAGEQADGKEDWRFENLTWRRSADAL